MTRGKGARGSPQPAKIPLPNDSDTGFWGVGMHLLLEEDVEGHERKEIEVGGHGDTAFAILWTGTHQSLGPL